ncbi:MAG: citramalate synthase [Armatimonadota bacterium]|nr:citramalate synthase [Armatimonadota bacterium]MDR7401564.1 citramalate synthase [Armatimonadota bacterium]MDR7403305.1 citramalate synthase [Armatimonadota bacterium]MDR7436831.1 citramalate synthase [Armatimonadota bacterium]MDR7471628.1 citramalate synthase [Armatimonadota bacterium]
MVRRIAVYDTTLRDGTQGAGIAFSADDKIRIARLLDELGVDYIEGGWPGSNPKDLAFFARARDLRWSRARVVAFGSTRRPGLRAEDDANLTMLLEAGTPAVALFGKSWDLHVTRALRTTLEENLRMIAESVAYLTRAGREVIYDAEHFFDGLRANPDYALATLRAARAAGAAVLVLCDTNGGSLPEDIRAGVERVLREVGGPVGIHTHNDGELAVANTLAAVQAGAVHVQGTINGYGERCGNANLCSVIPNLQLKMGYACLPEASLARLTDVSRVVSELANRAPDDQQPFVGRNAFAHKGGVHVSAVVADPATYEHIDPARVGNRRRVVVSDLSGQATVLYKAAEVGIPLDRSRPEVKEILARLKQLEHEGYQFEGAEASFELIMRRLLGTHRPLFTLHWFQVTVSGSGDGARAEATVKLSVEGVTEHTAADGNGPVHALDRALRKALDRFYPELRSIRLTDYKVRVLNAEAATAARVRVLIESTDGERTWGTVGASTNVVEASWLALVDSLEYGVRCRPTGPAATSRPGTSDGATRPAGDG